MPAGEQHSSQRRRLEGWKDIAGYLGRDQRTAQRYGTRDGLPVYREGGKVFANTDELDGWRSSRVVCPLVEPPLAVAIARLEVPPGPARARRLGSGIVVSALITIGALWAVLRPHELPLPAPPHWGRLLVRSTSERKSAQRFALARPGNHLAVKPDGSKIYALSEFSRTMSIVHTGDGSLATLTLPSDGRSLAMSPDGRKLYFGSTLSGIAVIDTETDRLRNEMIESGGPVFDLAITPDGKKLFMAMGRLGVKRLLTETNELRQITDRICPEYLKLDPRERVLYVSYQCGGPGGRSGHDAFEVFKTDTEKSMGVVSGPPMVGGIPAVSPDGRLVVLDGRDACVSPQYDHQGCGSVPSFVLHFMWADSRQIFKTLEMPMWHAPVRFVDSRKLLFLDDSISTMDSVSYTVLERWEHKPERYRGSALQPDRRWAYVGIDGGKELIALEAESPSCSPPALGLASFYPGDGVPEDIVGSATLTIVGDVQFAPGRVGQAFLLNGVSSYLAVPWTQHYRFGQRDSSVALYVKFSSTDAEATIMDRASSDTPVRARIIKTEDNHFSFEFTTGRDAPVRLRSTTSAIVDQWYHVAVTKNDEEVALYINGELEDRRPFRLGRFASEAGYPMPMYLGASKDAKQHVRGKLDEILFYGRALSGDEVRHLYQMRESGACRI